MSVNFFEDEDCSEENRGKIQVADSESPRGWKWVNPDEIPGTPGFKKAKQLKKYRVALENLKKAIDAELAASEEKSFKPNSTIQSECSNVIKYANNLELLIEFFE